MSATPQWPADAAYEDLDPPRPAGGAHRGDLELACKEFGRHKTHRLTIGFSAAMLERLGLTYLDRVAIQSTETASAWYFRLTPAKEGRFQIAAPSKQAADGKTRSYIYLSGPAIAAIPLFSRTVWEAYRTPGEGRLDIRINKASLAPSRPARPAAPSADPGFDPETLTGLAARGRDKARQLRAAGESLPEIQHFLKDQMAFRVSEDWLAVVLGEGTNP